MDSSATLEIVNHLVTNAAVQFKSQQRGESDLDDDEKRAIAEELYNRSKFAFLNRFGQHLTPEHLAHFTIYADESEVGAELRILIANLEHNAKARHRQKRNRRYQALKKLIDGNTYFSESEMMKRNPLLYDQLVGRYLSEDERRDRDRAGDNSTFVKILMEGIERDQARSTQKEQEEAEDNAMEEEDDDSSSCDENPPKTHNWGEFENMKDNRINKDEFYTKPNDTFITGSERALLREEFVTFMHQSFLDGLDEEFDYTTVDDNEEYDNFDIVTHDAEDKYFDSEEPEDAEMVIDAAKASDSSEDELDIYMSALNNHPAVCALSQEMKKL